MSDLKKLRWRCRRGTLELDLMLQRYLDHRYLAADVEEKQAFLRLLELEDSDLLKYLMGDCLCAVVSLRSIVQTIRSLPAVDIQTESSIRS